MLEQRDSDHHGTSPAMPIPEVRLVSSPAIDFSGFLPACKHALGYSLTKAADVSSYEMTDTQRFLWYLAAFRDKNVRVGPVLSSCLLPHLSFSIFVAADERDMPGILQCCSGMPFLVADTVDSSVRAAVITGTLAQWRDAVVSGSVGDAEPTVRAGFNKIHSLFKGMNLNVWSDYTTREASGGTFLLEHKIKR